MATFLDFRISDRNNFSYFDLQASSMLPAKVKVNWHFSSGEEANDKFSKRWPWRPSWISNRNNFSYFFGIQVIPMPPTKFQVNWPFDSGGEAKNRFLRWRPWISDQNGFSYFNLQVIQVSIGLSV